MENLLPWNDFNVTREHQLRCAQMSHQTIIMVLLFVDDKVVAFWLFYACVEFNNLIRFQSNWTIVNLVSWTFEKKYTKRDKSCIQFF